MQLLSRPKAPRPDIDRLRAVADHVYRVTAAMGDQPLRMRWELLNDAERADLADLVERVSDAGGWNVSALTAREQTRLEGLVEKGADAPDAFQNARETARLRTQVAAAERQASE